MRWRHPLSRPQSRDSRKLWNANSIRREQALLKSTRKVLTPYLVFGGAGVREVLAELMTHPPSESFVLPVRKKRERARERHLLLFLQRVCAKNDTLSEFGPGGWGTINGDTAGISLSPEAGIATREVFLERWTAHGVAAALNADADVRVELSPRLHPNGRIDGNHFIFADTAETTALDPKTIAPSFAVMGRHRPTRSEKRSPRLNSSLCET